MSQGDEQFSVLFEQASDGVFIADARGNYLDANPAGCLMLGYTKKEITRLSIADVITADEAERIAPELKTGVREGQIHNHWKFKRKDQSVFIGEVVGTVLSDGRLLATVRNVTDYMLFREIITGIDERSRLTLDYMLEGCQIIGFDWRYLYLNRKAEIHNRRPNEELLGKLFMDMWPGIQETEVYEKIKETLEKRVSHHFEFKYFFPDGDAGWFDLSIQPVPEGVFILSVDISERKKAGQALLDSEEKYRLVSDNTDDWIYWVSPQGQFNYISPACEWITGYSIQEFIDRPALYMDIVWPEDKEKVRQHNIESLNTEAPPHSLKFRITSKNGELRWIDHNCKSIYSQGEYKGLIGTNRDITEIKSGEEKLFESELKFRKIFEEGPLGMAMISGEFKFIMVNAQLCNMIGFSESELLQRTFRDITSPEDVKLDIQNMKRLISGQMNVYKTEKRYMRKDGQEIWGSLTVTPNFSDEGQFLYNVAIIEDITRRKTAEEALKKATERLRLATNVANVGIWDWNLQNDELFWEDKMYEIYGVEPEEFPGVYEGWMSRLHPEDAEYCNNVVHKVLRGEMKYELEFRVIWKDRSVHWITSEGQVIYDENNLPVRLIGVNYDITDRKLAEQELLSSKAKLETAIESMTDAVFISDVSGQFIQFNDAFATFHKFSSKEECSKTFAEYPDLFEIYYPNGELTPFDLWALPRALSGEIVKNEEYIMRRKDTGETWMASYSFAPIRDSNERIVGAVIAGRDITESKKAEEALKISEERYRNIFESAVIGIYRTTPDGRIIMANPTLINLLGFDSFEDLAQRNLEEEGFENKRKRASFREKIEREGRIIGLESEWKTKDGQSVFVSENARVFYDNKGNALYYEGTIEDITERKLMERNLRESEEKFRLLMESISLPVAYIDQEGVVLFRNTKFIQVFGYTQEEVPTVKEWWLKAYPDPVYREQVIKDWELFVNKAKETKKDTVSEEYYITCKDGSVRIIITSGIIISSNILITLIDVTDRKQAEIEIRKLNETLEKRVAERTDQLLEANRELEAFSYSVSHDLRAPLRHINGFVDLLNQKYRDLLPEKGQHYLKTIVESSNHMGTLIDDLLQFSRTGRQEMQQLDLDMNNVLQDILKLLNPDIQERNIEWKIAALPVVKGDQALLGMVWYNLLSNAVKFTKNRGLAIIEIGYVEEETEYLFFVKDNGSGFDMRYVHKLFGVFQRLHSRQEFEGTGIGLANVRRIIQKHGGRTWAESKLGEGAAFYFTLPKKR